MLINHAFRKDLVFYSNEFGTWETYDAEYCQHMKRYIKHQILKKFTDIRGKKIIVHWPSGLMQKTIPVISAIWELGGIVVVHDLIYTLQYNPLYQDFYSGIDYMFVQDGDLTHSTVASLYGSIAYKIHEIDYFDGNPNFGTIDNDPILASGTDRALMVTSSNTMRAPKQVYFTHNEIINAIHASQACFQFEEEEHVLHARALHHGASSAFYLFPSMCYSRHHYYKQNTAKIPEDDFIEVLSDERIHPITRFLIGTPITEQTIHKIKSIPRSLSLNFMTLHQLASLDQVDGFFDTNKIQKIIVLFGCSELLSIQLMQLMNKDTWAEERLTWKKNIFDVVPSKFYQYKLTDEGLSYKSDDMENFYTPGDDFIQVDSTRWEWLGRKTQFKNDGGVLLYPAALQDLLTQHYLELNPKVIADYKYKKFYLFLFEDLSRSTTQLSMDQVNQLIEKELNFFYKIEVVIYLDVNESEITTQRAPTDNHLKFLARRQLNLDTEV